MKTKNMTLIGAIMVVAFFCSIPLALCDSATFEAISPLDGDADNSYTLAVNVSPDGSTISGSSSMLYYGSTPFVLKEGTMETLAQYLGEQGYEWPTTLTQPELHGIARNGLGFTGSVSCMNCDFTETSFQFSLAERMHVFNENEQVSSTAISDDGLVVVGSKYTQGRPKAFRRAVGEEHPTDLGTIDNNPGSSVAKDVSGDGQIVVGIANGQAFRWIPGTEGTGTMTGLGFLQGALMNESDAWAISNDGSAIVGRSHSANTGWSSSRYEPFLWTQETGMIGLGDLAGGDFDGQAWAVARLSSGKTFVVGRSKAAAGDDGWRAFLWDSESQGMYNLQVVLSADYGLDMTNWNLMGATDIAVSTTDTQSILTIVGYGYYTISETQSLLRGWVVRIAIDNPGPRCGNGIVEPNAGEQCDPEQGESVFDVCPPVPGQVIGKYCSACQCICPNVNCAFGSQFNPVTCGCDSVPQIPRKKPIAAVAVSGDTVQTRPL